MSSEEISKTNTVATIPDEIIKPPEIKSVGERLQAHQMQDLESVKSVEDVETNRPAIKLQEIPHITENVIVHDSSGERMLTEETSVNKASEISPMKECRFMQAPNSQAKGNNNDLKASLMQIANKTGGFFQSHQNNLI